jgi:hypothetical protein
LLSKKDRKFLKYLLGFVISISLFAQLIAQSNLNVTALMDSVNLDRLKSTIDSLTWAGGHQSRVTFSEGNYRAAEYIARSFNALPGITSVQMDTFYYPLATSPYNNYPLYNVIATLQGSSEQEIIIGGHYDASCSREGSETWNSNWSTLKAQGADDNASGIAALLEIARLLSDPANAYVNTYTLKFIAFAAEESNPQTYDNHLGSTHDVFERQAINEDIKAVLIMDMIAFNTVMDYMEIISNTESVWLADSVHYWAENYVMDLTVNDFPYPDVSYSDHDSYQNYGIPAILLMENDSPWNSDVPYYIANANYHTLTDTYNTLNFSLLRKTTQLALVSAVLLDQTVTSIHRPSVTVNRKLNTGIQLSAFPNPFNSRTSVRILLSRNEYLNFCIYDIEGKKVAQILQNQFMSSGQHVIGLDLDLLSTGIYFGVVESAGSKEIIKFMLIQ